MKTYINFIVLLVLGLQLFVSCTKDSEQEKDTEKPIINMESNDAFPKPCDTIYRGEDFIFKATFSDNVELGSYNLELHHNFDHHTHGSHTDTCPMDPDTEPVNPFYYNESFMIPAGNKSFTVERSVSVPLDVDKGDYHFMVKLTDEEGWQSWQSVSVKIIEQ